MKLSAGASSSIFSLSVPKDKVSLGNRQGEVAQQKLPGAQDNRFQRVENVSSRRAAGKDREAQDINNLYSA